MSHLPEREIHLSFLAVNKSPSTGISNLLFWNNFVLVFPCQRKKGLILKIKQIYHLEYEFF